ncbi:GTPase IMAP family member 8-like isoform X2 [Mugil cephalus]|uniref:GTPase IMAP family member 8-like isoform X2 n=1 Tax=Mugil cephalus TaxID=48193 RepID=UPI001FB7212E|nr:GTPase IMAP family member 8-like isoform X2 [Mugil cephalus]
MSHNSLTNTRQRMVVVSAVEVWASLKSLLQDSSEETSPQSKFSSVGSNQVCDLTVEGNLMSLHYAELQEDMTEECVTQALEGCFKSCKEGIRSFLLLIQGGYYTKRDRRMVEILQAQFGAEALKYLVILSVEDGKVIDTLDDTLLDLINMCDGRYSRVASSAPSDGLRALLEMVDFMLAENGAAGYTDAVLAAVRKRSTENSAMNMLKQKMQEAEEKAQAFRLLMQQQEDRRAREMEELKAKHAEERMKEAAERKQYETKREGLEEAVMSHRSMLQLHMGTPDDETKKISIILLGLSGSGKSSALNLIVERAGNQYSVNGPGHETAPPTLFCERRETVAAGRQLILVDTPELWDEDGVENVEQVKDCLALALPGPHVFLLVLQVGRFTQGECEMLGHLQKIFGREFAEHAIILFVQFDANQYRPQKINDYVTGAHSTLQELIRKCGCRYYELNITKSQNALSYPQVKDLLAGINKLVASHGGHPYSTKRFSVQELQDRNNVIEDRKDGALEVNYLLRDE